MTRQRRVILEIVRMSDKHLTAQEIADEAKGRINNIGLGTVYRNLNLLCESGEIMRIKVPDAPDSFDKNTFEHAHMMCISCGTLYDVDVNRRALLRSVKSPHGKVLDYKIHLYGVCNECAEKKGGRENGQ